MKPNQISDILKRVSFKWELCNVLSIRERSEVLYEDEFCLWHVPDREETTLLFSGEVHQIEESEEAFDHPDKAYEIEEKINWEAFDNRVIVKATARLSRLPNMTKDICIQYLSEFLVTHGRSALRDFYAYLIWAEEHQSTLPAIKEQRMFKIYHDLAARGDSSRKLECAGYRDHLNKQELK